MQIFTLYSKHHTLCCWSFIYDQSTVMPVRVQVLQTLKIEYVPHSNKNGFLLVNKNNQSSSYFFFKYYNIHKVDLINFMRGEGY